VDDRIPRTFRDNNFKKSTQVFSNAREDANYQKVTCGAQILSNAQRISLNLAK